jgi:hypothetical protein
MLFKVPNGDYSYEKDLLDLRSDPKGREGPKIPKVIVTKPSPK